jgi:hypothetical protein
MNQDHTLIASYSPSMISDSLSGFNPTRLDQFLIPLEILASSDCHSVSDLVSYLASGSAKPILDDDNDPSWATALASPD